MLIVANKESRFTDYYDTVMKSGVDRSTVYVRNKSNVDITDGKDEVGVKYTRTPKEYKVKDTTYQLNFGTLLFCGKAYPHVTVKTSCPNENATVDVYYNADFTDQLKISNRFWNYYSKRTILKAAMDEFLVSEEDSFKLNLKYSSPVILIEKSPFYNVKYSLLINPKLADIKFFKVKNPFETFQEIYQYISSALTAEKVPEPSNVADKFLITGHGFDPKWSFRKPPAK